MEFSGHKDHHGHNITAQCTYIFNTYYIESIVMIMIVQPGIISVLHKAF